MCLLRAFLLHSCERIIVEGCLHYVCVINKSIPDKLGVLAGEGSYYLAPKALFLFSKGVLTTTQIASPAPLPWPMP